MNPNEKPPVTPIPLTPLLPTLDAANLIDFLSPPTSPSHLIQQEALGSPSPPPPAYSALPYRDTDFDFAPILNGKIGDVELETTDGKRFLVHRTILETETVFFHIYYGFVPAWRLTASASACANLPPNPHLPNPPQIPAAQPTNDASRSRSSDASQPAGIAPPAASIAALGLNNLLALPRLLTSLYSSPAALADQLARSSSTTTSPPVPPPKAVTAPTPTNSPYTWSVPEHSSILFAFLSLIYPPGFLSSSRTSHLTSPEVTAKVIRAAMGYQSAKALQISRDRLGYWVKERPVDIYAMATFFKFADLAIMASRYAIAVPREEWSGEAVKMMGRSGMARLLHLQDVRVVGLRSILHSMPMEEDVHFGQCGYSSIICLLWASRCEQVSREIRPESELLELLDISGAALPVSADVQTCGQCFVLFGNTVRKCIEAAKEL